MKQRTKQNDEIDQVFCMTADAGHVWMHVFDTLPLPVRRRLRNSAFNLCAACLEAFVLPQVLAKHPKLSREKALFAAVEVMEAEMIRRGTVRQHPR
jgi:hypothetical protein